MVKWHKTGDGDGLYGAYWRRSLSDDSIERLGTDFVRVTVDHDSGDEDRNVAVHDTMIVAVPVVETVHWLEFRWLKPAMIQEYIRRRDDNAKFNLDMEPTSRDDILALVKAVRGRY